jgi:hypothetical protein
VRWERDCRRKGHPASFFHRIFGVVLRVSKKPASQTRRGQGAKTTVLLEKTRS